MAGGEGKARIPSSSAETHLRQANDLEPCSSALIRLLDDALLHSDLPESLLNYYLELVQEQNDEERQLRAYAIASDRSLLGSNQLLVAAQIARKTDDENGQVLLRKFLSVLLSVNAQDLLPWTEFVLERVQLAEKDHEYPLAASILGELLRQQGETPDLDLSLRHVQMVAEHLQDTAQARGIYESLLSERPDEVRIWSPLLAIYRNAGDETKLCELLESLEKLSLSPDEMRIVQLERIRLMISSGDLGEAEERLRAILGEAPENDAAADLLLALLSPQEDRLEERVELLESLFDQARSRDDALSVTKYALQLAELHRVERREEAVSILVASLPLASAQRELLETLLGLFTDEDNQSDRAEAMEHLLALERGAEAEGLLDELTQLRRQEMDEYGVGRALEIAFSVAGEREQIAANYLAYLKDQEDYGRLGEVLLERAERESDDVRAAQFLAEAAGVFADQLGDPLQGAEALMRARGRDPQNATYLDGAINYFVLVGEVERALELLAKAANCEDVEQQVVLLEKRARLALNERREDLDVLRAAVADLDKALGLVVREEQRSELQEALLQTLFALRESEAATVNQEAERIVVLKLAGVQSEVGDATGAVDTLASWLRSNEDDLEVAKNLGEQAERAGDLSAACFAWEKLAEASEGMTRRDAVLKFADAAERSGNPLDARGLLEAVYLESERDPELRARLRRLYEAAGAYTELADVLKSELEGTDDEERHHLLLEIGDLYLNAQDASAAQQIFESAKEIGKAPFVVASKMAQSFLLAGNIEAAQAMLDENLVAHGKRRTPELASLQFSLAKVAEAKGDVDGMFSWLESALMSDRNNGAIAAELAQRAQDAERYDSAIKALQVLTLRKEPGPISKAEAYFRQAQIAEAQGDGKKALLLARRATATDRTMVSALEMVQRLG
ncbi:MAG: hypothetical protein MK135_11565 [Polyangiaceae bacterium]|nr:hypothetical protein [Polyangiaceae bacterium]